MTNPTRVVAATAVLAMALAACGTAPPGATGAAAGAAVPMAAPAGWSAPQVLVAPSALQGVHGLAIDARGRLLAGTVTGNAMWEVDRGSGKARVFIAPPQGQSDDIAIGPRGELAWTSFLQGIVRARASDDAPIRELATGLPGINSLAYDPRNGRLYATQVFLGDALWEIDPAGARAPRPIAKDLGGLNGFEVGPDGMIYGPLWFKGQVVRVDPASGAVTVLNDQFKVPSAVNLDGKGNAWVTDTRTGELARIDLATGRKTVAAQLRTALDNLAIAPDGTIYVSNMADNSIEAFDPATGQVRVLIRGNLAAPGGLAIDGDTLYVADLFGFRRVDTRTGRVADVLRMHGSDMEYPFAVGLSPRDFLLTSWFTSTVQVIDRATLKTRAMLHGPKAPMGVVALPDGSIAYAEFATGSIVRASGADYAQRAPIAQGLSGPVQMVVARDGALVVTEAAGRLVRIDPSDGRRTVLADGLQMPEGVAQTPWGSFVVAESAARRLTEIDPARGLRRTVAEGLPIGFEPSPGLPAPNIITGVAVRADGTIFMSADRDNAIYRIDPKR